uniref:Activating signal cointegrator 1 complex subunit 2 n=1 Tax=Nothobranchius kadleci TaxID=1051664 RepID=A0A1A8BT68_NOTKA
MAGARVPLDEQQVTEPDSQGRAHTLPALHPDRKEDRCFVPYKTPPVECSPAGVEEFLEHARFITEDLEWLLSLPHDKFWCQVVFDESLQGCLDSYLRHAPRGLDLLALPSSPAVADVQRAIHRAIFLVFLRMATHKESKESFLTPAVFGEIIYNNFLFDVPKMMDLCVLFGKGNSQLLHKMIENVFTQQPAYYSDLDETVPTVLQVFDTILEKFLTDYDELFPISDDISLLQQALPIIDETRTSYLLQGVESARDSLGRWKSQVHKPASSSSSPSACQGAEGGAAAVSSSDSFSTPEAKEWRGAEAMVDVPPKGNNGAVCPVSEAELESLLSCIRDLLPDLGEGFLLACLQEYGYSSEVVINNILEDRLAPHLEQLDRAMPRPVKEELPAVLNSRSNVFDDDEFDIFRRDQVDMSRIWKGRRKGESTREMLNDKKHVAEQRARYQTYENVIDEVDVNPGDSATVCGLDDYDDEYDDTYDMNQVGANDLDGDSLLNRRPFTVPQVLRQVARVEEEEDGEDAEEDVLKSNPNRDQFVQDPALLRERAEARRAAMQQRRGVRPERTSNVVGRPKGQGQTSETTSDRRKKETNKSRVGNHNRRTMADRKRNKGMIPS